MNIYLAGPMRGIPEFNFPAFKRAAIGLRAAGNVVFNPAERDEDVYGKEFFKSTDGDQAKAAQKGFSLRDALGADLDWICREAEAIVMMPGWEKSLGAQAEHATAKALGLRVLYLELEEPWSQFEVEEVFRAVWGPRHVEHAA